MHHFYWKIDFHKGFLVEQADFFPQAFVNWNRL